MRLLLLALLLPYAAARAAERAEEEATELWQLMFDYRTRMRPTVETIRDIIRK